MTYNWPFPLPPKPRSTNAVHSPGAAGEAEEGVHTGCLSISLPNSGNIPSVPNPKQVGPGLKLSPWTQCQASLVYTGRKKRYPHNTWEKDCSILHPNLNFYKAAFYNMYFVQYVQPLEIGHIKSFKWFHLKSHLKKHSYVVHFLKSILKNLKSGIFQF